MVLRFFLAVAVLVIAAPAQATEGAQSPLATWGEERFPPLYREALQTYVDAAAAYRKGEYKKAAQTLELMWARHPPGTKEWKQFQAATVPLHSVADFGAPPVYAALRMLTECAQWRATAGNVKPRDTIRLTVLLIGESEGLAPSTREELQRGGGQRAVHVLEAAFHGQRASRLLDETYWLFDEYVLAITRGELGLRRVVVPLPDFRVALALRPGVVKLSRPETERIFAAVPTEIARAADWWHIVYPSHVPNAAAFEGVRFVTGGIRAGPRGSGAPCFLSEDLKLLRAPNQDGRHVLSSLEREVALPQWLQHEFFHHLFGLYRDEQLEARSHQWHDRKTWPSDFEGVVEADYYAEALHKRLLRHAAPPLSKRLRHTGTGGARAGVDLDPED